MLVVCFSIRFPRHHPAQCYIKLPIFSRQHRCVTLSRFISLDFLPQSHQVHLASKMEDYHPARTDTSLDSESE